MTTETIRATPKPLALDWCDHAAGCQCIECFDLGVATGQICGHCGDPLPEHGICTPGCDRNRERLAE